jgi:hypothetical protein
MSDEAVDNAAAASAGTDAPAEGAMWYDGFSEEIKGDPSIQKFENAETLAKSYINAQQLIGRDKIPMPLTDEDWSNTYSRLGRPETAEDYQFKMPDGREGDNSWFRETAHKLGLNENQAAGLNDKFYEMVSEFEAADATEKENAIAELTEKQKKEWGSKYDSNVALAQKGLVEFANEEFLNFLEESGLGNHPSMIDFALGIGKTLAEDGQLTGGEDNGFTAIELDAAISGIMSNPAYKDAQHPEHASLVKKMTALMEEKHGQE